MKLLFDQNLSPRLVTALADVYPESAHVQSFGMAEATDAAVLDFAQGNGFILVSKDSDFFDPQLIRGRSSKIVWIRRGNCATRDIEAILRRHAGDVRQLAATEHLLLLMLY